MVNTRLLLVNEQQTGSPPVDYALNCPAFENIPVPLTLQIADVREPNNGTGSYSNTIRIPGSQEVNIFFDNVYDVNISLQTFNPHLKVRAYYYVNEVLNFEGYLQVLSIDVDEVTKDVVYNCNIIGEVISFFTKIKDRYLTDLVFNPAYNVTLTGTNIINSWTNLGSNWVAGFIDWGVNNSNMNFVKPQHLRPILFIREYMLLIFQAAGYTWTSTILDSTSFKRKVMPPTETPALSSSVMANNKFRASADGTQTFTNSLAVAGVQLIYLIYASSTNNLIHFQNDSTLGNYDAGGLFDAVTTFAFTPAITNYYNTNANIGINFVVKKNGVPDYTATGITGTINIITSFGIATVNCVDLNFALGNSNNISVPANNVQLYAASPKSCALQFTSMTLTSSIIGAGTWTIEATIVSGSNFSSEFSSNALYEGYTINIQDCIPLNVKQSEFISWVFRVFHLYVTVDKTNSKNLIIEDRPNFYGTTAVDWTHKHDKGSSIQVIPLGELNNNKYTYTYKQGEGDYYNALYTDEYKEAYGTYRKNIANDFVKGENVLEVGFAPTPYAINPNLPALIPQILTKSNGVITPCKPSPRILHWSGMISLPSSQWTLSAATGTVVHSTYPHVGHCDNPYSPTEDISWGVPRKIYAPSGILPTTWTTNNLYNKYYSQYIDQISDKNSKLIRTKFYLSANDINIFDFRYPVFTVINGEQGYYLVNKIEEYNPIEEGSTMVELLKLTDYPIFTPGMVNLGDEVGGGNMGNV